MAIMTNETPYPNLKEFADFVEAGRPLAQARDNAAWPMGELVADFCTKFNIDVKAGKPTHPDEPKLADLADAWDIELARLSEWRKCWVFYAPHFNFRSDENKPFTWTHYNAARRFSDGKLDNALELLDAAERQHMSANEFRRYLKDRFSAVESKNDPEPIPDEGGLDPDLIDDSDTRPFWARIIDVFATDDSPPAEWGDARPDYATEVVKVAVQKLRTNSGMPEDAKLKILVIWEDESEAE
jgi:hypothetical protein